MAKYPNLEAEIARHGLLKQDIADSLGVARNTFYRWVNGETEFPLAQAKTVHRRYFGECEFSYLFTTLDEDGGDE